MPRKEIIAMKNEYDYLNDVKMDFSCYEEETITEKELKSMKRYTNKRTVKKYLAAAACISLLTVTSAFASGLVGNIIKTIQTGHNSFVQIDSNVPQPLPDELKDKIFNKNGNPVDSITRSEFDNIYDADGNKITEEKFAKLIEEATGGLVRVESDKNSAEEAKKNFATIDAAQSNAVFDIKIPEYLPDDYLISRIYTYKEEDGSPSGEYITIVYKNSNDEDITIHERILNENTAFEAGTDGKVEELTINGRTAVIMNESSLNLETEDDVSVGIYTHGNISRAELVKIAESVK